MEVLSTLNGLQNYFLNLDAVAHQYGVSLAFVVTLMGVHILVTLLWTMVLIERAQFTGLMSVYHLISFSIIASILAYLIIAVMAHTLNQGQLTPILTYLNLT